MSPRRTLAQVSPFMGTDLALEYALSMGYFEDGDLASRPQEGSRARDLIAVSGVDNLTQALANRLKTRRGELAPLGHPDYGSRHHELIGEPNVDRTRNLIKLYILQALRDEPRIEKVLSVTVRPEHQPPREVVRIEASLRVWGEARPLNLVVPFSLEALP